MDRFPDETNPAAFAEPRRIWVEYIIEDPVLSEEIYFQYIQGVEDNSDLDSILTLNDIAQTLPENILEKTSSKTFWESVVSSVAQHEFKRRTRLILEEIPFPTDEARENLVNKLYTDFNESRKALLNRRTLERRISEGTYQHTQRKGREAQGQNSYSLEFAQRLLNLRTQIFHETGHSKGRVNMIKIAEILSTEFPEYGTLTAKKLKDIMAKNPHIQALLKNEES